MAEKTDIGGPPSHGLFSFPNPGERMAFTGERYVPGVTGPIQHEHYHRYLFAAPLCRGHVVLDIACGEGFGCFLLAQAAAEVVGVDIDAQTVHHAERQYASPRLRFLVGNATAIPVPAGSVDVVTSFETIEHFQDHELFLAEVDRVLRPGGCSLYRLRTAPFIRSRTGTTILSISANSIGRSSDRHCERNFPMWRSTSSSRSSARPLSPNERCDRGSKASKVSTVSTIGTAKAFRHRTLLSLWLPPACCPRPTAPFCSTGPTSRNSTGSISH